MKVYRDLEYVKKRKRIAAVSSLAGIALLGAAFWMASTGGQSGILVAYVPLLAGTIIFHLGMQQVGKWSRAQRNDVILDALLKELGERYSLIHYAKLGKRVVEHALVYPGGVLTVTARELPGGVAYRDGRWRKVGQGLSRFFGMGGAFLGNPTADASTDVKVVRERLAEEQLEAEVDGVVAFINPRVTIDVTDPDFPVTNGEGLRPYIQSLSGVRFSLAGNLERTKDKGTKISGSGTLEAVSDSSLDSAERQRVVELLTSEGTFETPQVAPTRRPVKRRAA